MNLFGQMKDTHHIRAVQNRLSSLIKQKVITKDVVSFELITYDERRMPRIVATLDQLTRDKCFSGLEPSVERFTELVTQGKISSCLPE